jgi:hypothetical protein
MERENNMSEIKEIMDALGRNEHEGEVRGSHLGKILTFLQQQKTGDLTATISQLALICGMKARYVKEDYINGMIVFGIIHISTSKNQTIWKWNGMRAFERNNGDNEK